MTVERVRLFIVAEVRFYREGLALFFGDRPSVEVVGTSTDVAIAVRLAAQQAVDVVLLDLHVSHCVGAARRLLNAAPALKIVAVGLCEDEREVIALAEAGISGFVAREASLADLGRAFDSAATGETRCSPRVAAILARRVSILAHHITADRTDVPLTARQLEIVQLIGEGLSNKAIAQRLFIEVPTVKNHVHNILERLGVARRTEAVTAIRGMGAGITDRI